MCKFRQVQQVNEDGQIIMANVRKLAPGTSPQHHFGAEVRYARERAGMTQAELATICHVDVSMVSRIECGISEPPKGFADGCDQAFPEMGGWFGRFCADSPTWEGPYPKWFDEWLAAEREAVLLRIWQPLIVPGLLQTADYARAVFLGQKADLDDDKIGELVAGRVQRQAIFARPEPPELLVVIDEFVLRRCVGSPAVMHATARPHGRDVQAVEYLGPGSTGEHRCLSWACRSLKSV